MWKNVNQAFGKCLMCIKNASHVYEKCTQKVYHVCEKSSSSIEKNVNPAFEKERSAFFNPELLP